MLAILLDHGSLKTARRAALASAFITLLVRNVTISGDGFTLLGVTLHISEQTMHRATWLVALYCFLIFSGFVAAQLVDASNNYWTSKFEKSKNNELRCIDEDRHGDHYGDQWQAMKNDVHTLYESKKLKLDGITGPVLSFVSALVDFVVAWVISAIIVIAPNATASLLLP